MLQRALMLVLVDGIKEILNDTKILSEYLMLSHGLLEAEADEAIQYFAANPPKVSLGYVRGEDLAPPQYSVILGGEQESDRFIGDDGGFVDGSPVNAGVWVMRYQVVTYARNPNVAAWYYEIAKLCIIRGRSNLFASGAHGYDLSGSDLNPSTSMLPAGVFGRQLTVSLAKNMVTSPREAQRATSVHVRTAASLGLE